MTCYQPRKDSTVECSVVDYVVASEVMLLSEIIKLDVTPMNPFSDHCLLEVTLKSSVDNVVSTDTYDNSLSSQNIQSLNTPHYKWSGEYINAYFLCSNEYDALDIQEKLTTFNGDYFTDSSADEVLDSFHDIIYYVANRVLPKTARFKSKHQEHSQSYHKKCC